MDKYKDDNKRVAIALNSSEFEDLKHLTTRNTFFIAPIPKATGTENVLIQFQDTKSVLVCDLHSYKTDPQHVTAIVTYTMYDELLEKKSIVLIRGDIINHLLINKEEASWLLKYIKHFYTKRHKAKWVEIFNQRPYEFRYDDFLIENRSSFNEFWD